MESWRFLYANFSLTDSIPFVRRRSCNTAFTQKRVFSELNFSCKPRKLYLGRKNSAPISASAQMRETLHDSANVTFKIFGQNQLRPPIFVGSFSYNFFTLNLKIILVMPKNCFANLRIFIRFCLRRNPTQKVRRLRVSFQPIFMENLDRKTLWSFVLVTL